MPVTQSDTPIRFLRSAGAATFSQAWRIGVTFLTYMVLRRFIPREEFGIYDWVEVIFLVLGAVRDLGLPVHTIRVKSKPFGNLLALEGIWGTSLAVAVFLAAPLLVRGLSHPDPLVVPVLMVMTLFLVFEGLAAVPLVYFEGELKVGRAVLPELVRNLVFAVTSIALALTGHGVWSIVIGQVSASGVFAAFLWLRARGSIPLTFLPRAMGKLLSGSVRLAIVWLLILLVRYVDRLILGARFPLDTVSTYSFAYFAAFLVPYVMLQPVGRAAYPAFIALAHDRAKQFDAYRFSTLFLLAIEVPAALFLFFNADAAIRLLGGDQWVGAPHYLRILAFAPLIDPFSRFGGELLATRGRDGTWIGATSLTLISFVFFGVLFTGSPLAAAGMAWANFLPLGGLLMTWAVSRLAPKGAFRGLVAGLVQLYLIPLPFFLAAFAIAGPNIWLRFALSLVSGLVTVAIYWWRFGGQFVGFFKGTGSIEN